MIIFWIILAFVVGYLLGTTDEFSHWVKNIHTAKDQLQGFDD